MSSLTFHWEWNIFSGKHALDYSLMLRVSPTGAYFWIDMHGKTPNIKIWFVIICSNLYRSGLQDQILFQCCNCNLFADSHTLLGSAGTRFLEALGKALRWGPTPSPTPWWWVVHLLPELRGQSGRSSDEWEPWPNPDIPPLLGAHYTEQWFPNYGSMALQRVMTQFLIGHKARQLKLCAPRVKQSSRLVGVGGKKHSCPFTIIITEAWVTGKEKLFLGGAQCENLWERLY